MDDHATFNPVLARWNSVLERMTPPASDEIRRRIARYRANVRRLDDPTIPDLLREQMIEVAELISTDTTLPKHVRDESAAAAATARAKWGID